MTVWDISDTEIIFLDHTIGLLSLILPAALCFFIWRVFITNKRQPVLVLGLSSNDPEILLTGHKSFFLCAATALITFGIGVAFAKAYEFIVEWVISV